MYGLLAQSTVLTTVLSVIAAILILLATITVHEFGHYIVGKLLKFNIKEFAIGMGPAIYKKVKKNGEIFSIRIFPLGGFCAFEGEDEDDDSVAAAQRKKERKKHKKSFKDSFADTDDGADNAASSDDLSGTGDFGSACEGSPSSADNGGAKKLSENAFNNKKPWQRILVLIAGASFNFIVAVLIVMIYFTAYGHFGFMAYEVDKSGGYIESGMALEDKDVIMEIDGKFMYFTTDLISALNGKKAGDIVTVTVQTESGERTTREVALREDVSIESSADVYPALRALGVATVLKLSTVDGCVLKDDEYVYRFKDSDKLEDCTRIYTLDDLYERLKDLSAGETIDLVIPDGDDDGENDVVTLTAPLTFDEVDKTDRTAVLAAFGINDEETLTYQVGTQSVYFGFFEGLGRAVVYSFKTVGVTLESFWQLLTGKLSLTSVSGPVGTISLTSQYVSLGFKYVLNIASMIGLSVAIFNLLPIPALDGARVVFVIIEWIRKKPINRNVEGMIHFVGLILLVLFAVAVDLLKLF